MQNIKCNIERFREYQLDYDLLRLEADEISKHKSDYYSFCNLELALAVYNYIEKDYCNVTIHFYRGQHICCSDIARKKLRSKMISWRDDIIKDLTDINNVIDKIL